MLDDAGGRLFLLAGRSRARFCQQHQYDTGGINRTDGLYLSFTNSLFAVGFAEWFFIPGAADRLPCHVWYCSKAVMNGSDSAALVGADWESLSSVQFVPKDGTLCAPGSEFALYGLKR